MMRNRGWWAAGVVVSLAALPATPAVAQDPEPSIDFRADPPFVIRVR